MNSCASFQPVRVPRGCTRDEGRSLGAGLQERASNHLMLLRLKGVVVSDEEKAAMKLSGMLREDERKRTADEASKWIKALSKGVDASSTLISSGGTCLRTRWQPVYRRHDLHTGFGTERENLVPDAKENDKWPTP